MGSKSQLSETDRKYISAVAWLLRRLWRDLKFSQHIADDKDSFIYERKRTSSWLRAYKTMNIAMCSDVISFQAYEKVHSALERTINRVEDLRFKEQLITEGLSTPAAKETA